MINNCGKCHIKLKSLCVLFSLQTLYSNTDFTIPPPFFLIFIYLAVLGLSCGMRACRILVPQPGIQPISPALQGRFLVTGPLGKSLGPFLPRNLHQLGFPCGSEVQNMRTKQEIWVWSLGQEDPLEKEMAAHPKYSCLEHPMDRRAWQAAVHGVAKSWTQLCQQIFTFLHTSV